MFRANASLAEQIAQHLGEQIIRGEIIPGERIQELRIASELEVSRGSVREALLLLERRHLIDILPRRGATVRELSENQVRSLYEIMQILLGLVVRKAIRSIKEEELDPFIELIHHLQEQVTEKDIEGFFNNSFKFLSLFYAYANNPYVEDMLESLEPALQRCYYIAIHLNDNEVKECLGFFKATIETIFRRDPRSALEIIREFAEHQSALVSESIQRARQIEAAWGKRRR